jgi:alanyl-tRNA synthetase
MQETMLIYMQEQNKFELETTITSLGEDEKGKYFITKETVVYPQGGGQPSDFAEIITNSTAFNVHFAKLIEKCVRHYYTQASLEINQKILIQINKERRILNARYHTAGHLIGDLLLSHYGVLASKGHQFPNEAYIETDTDTENAIEIEEFEKLLNDYIQNSKNIETKEITKEEYEEKYGLIQYFIPEGKTFRMCHIDGLIPVPCGGTHLKQTKEIGKIELKKILRKGGKIKVSYQLV